MDAIVIDSLTKQFPTKHSFINAVDNLSVSIPKGQIVGLLGPNGAGKTTTIRTIASIYKPSFGSILVNGLDTVRDSLAIRKSIGIAHENPSFYKKLTGRRNLRFYAELYDVPIEEINSRVDRLATEFDLLDAIDQPVGSYSKGMKQKLSVAKALIHDPDILIMDEPWSGLSPGATRDLRIKIQELGNQGKTILITTHNLAQAEQVVDNLVLISHGKVVAMGTPDFLRKQYNIDPQVIVVSNSKFTTEQVQEIIDNFDFVTSVDSQDQDGLIKLTFSVSSFDHTPQIVSHLVSRGLGIKQVTENIPSLEELYLNLVEDGNR